MHVVAIVAVADGPLPDGAVAVGPLAAVPGPDDPIGHAQRVTELARQRPTLPVRYGATVPREALAASLRGREADLLAALRRVAGHDEWAVTVPAQPASTPTSGAAYLRDKLERRRAAEAAAAALDAAVGGYATARTHRLLPRDRALVAAAYLVPRADTEAFLDAVAGTGATCTGPWAAWSFPSASVGAFREAGEVVA